MIGAIGAPRFHTLPDAVSRAKSEPSVYLVGSQRRNTPCVYVNCLRLEERDPCVFGRRIIRESGLKEFSISPRRLFKKRQESSCARSIPGGRTRYHRADQGERTAYSLLVRRFEIALLRKLRAQCALQDPEPGVKGQVVFDRHVMRAARHVSVVLEGAGGSVIDGA